MTSPETLDALFLARAAEHADRPFLLEPAASFGEVLAHAQKVQGFLEARGAGERVGLLLPDPRAFAASLFGALLAGWTAAPIDPRLKPPEIGVILGHTGCEALIDGAVYNAVIRGDPLRPSRSGSRSPGDPAVILTTSGSTAAPKAVVLTHQNLRTNQRSFQERYGFSAGDVFLSTLSLAHSFGLTACLFTALDVGAALAVVGDPQPARIAALAVRHRPTVF